MRSDKRRLEPRRIIGDGYRRACAQQIEIREQIGRVNRKARAGGRSRRRAGAGSNNGDNSTQASPGPGNVGCLARGTRRHDDLTRFVAGALDCRNLLPLPQELLAPINGALGRGISRDPDAGVAGTENIGAMP